MGQPQFDAADPGQGLPQAGRLPAPAPLPDSTVATVGEKNYAVHTMGGPGSDIRLTFSGRSYDCDTRHRGREQLARPDRPRRAVVHLRPDVQPLLRQLGQDAQLVRHPDDGAGLDVPARGQPRRTPAPTRATRAATSGSRTRRSTSWTTRTDWSGMLLTYGGIDKAGHMWGGLNDKPPYPGADRPQVHMANMAKVADQQVGRVIAKLKDDRPARRDARRPHHRPRAAAGRRRSTASTSAGRGQLQLVLRDRRGRDLPTSRAPRSQKLIDGLGGTTARQQRPDEHAGLRDPHLARPTRPARKKARPRR